MSRKDFLIMQFEDNFRLEQKNKGIENPWDIEHELRYGRLIEDITYFKEKPVKSFKFKKYTEEEMNILDNLQPRKEEWNATKEEYMINALLNSKEFELEEIASLYPTAAIKFKPCEVGSCQCKLDCINYFNCPYKEG